MAIYGGYAGFKGCLEVGHGFVVLVFIAIVFDVFIAVVVVVVVVVFAFEGGSYVVVVFFF